MALSKARVRLKIHPSPWTEASLRCIARCKVQCEVRYTLHLGLKQQPPQMPLFMHGVAHHLDHDHYQSLVSLIVEVKTDLRQIKENILGG